MALGRVLFSMAVALAKLAKSICFIGKHRLCSEPVKFDKPKFFLIFHKTIITKTALGATIKSL